VWDYGVWDYGGSAISYKSQTVQQKHLDATSPVDVGCSSLSVTRTAKCLPIFVMLLHHGDILPQHCLQHVLDYSQMILVLN
jgi:hypothetical protein